MMTCTAAGEQAAAERHAPRDLAKAAMAVAEYQDAVKGTVANGDRA